MRNVYAKRVLAGGRRKQKAFGVCVLLSRVCVFYLWRYRYVQVVSCLTGYSYIIHPNVSLYQPQSRPSTRGTGGAGKSLLRPRRPRRTFSAAPPQLRSRECCYPRKTVPRKTMTTLIFILITTCKYYFAFLQKKLIAHPHIHRSRPQNLPVHDQPLDARCTERQCQMYNANKHENPNFGSSAMPARSEMRCPQRRVRNASLELPEPTKPATRSWTRSSSYARKRTILSSGASLGTPRGVVKLKWSAAPTRLCSLWWTRWVGRWGFGARSLRTRYGVTPPSVRGSAAVAILASTTTGTGRAGGAPAVLSHTPPATRPSPSRPSVTDSLLEGSWNNWSVGELEVFALEASG